MAMYDLSIVVPTLNEADNIRPFYERLSATLTGVHWEVVFVDDDSTDATADTVWALAEEHDNIRCLKRIGRRGLASACIEGMLATGAPYIAVMDADLQHDERLLPTMLQHIRSENLDIVVGSRFLAESKRIEFSSSRERLSQLGNRLASLIIRSPLSDPLSGFFMLRRSLLDEVAHSLTGEGFKILLDIFASARRPLRFVELPFEFGQRHAGTSKLDTLVSFEFLLLLADKTLGRYVPVRFVLFVMVGMTGVIVHLAALGLFFKGLGQPFAFAQAAATVIAMTSNFYLNNIFTYRDRRLRGVEFFRGLIIFCVACTLGAAVNVAVAEFLFENAVPWPLAGVVGAFFGSVWNFAVTSTFTWKRKREASAVQVASSAAPTTTVEPKRATEP